MDTSESEFPKQVDFLPAEPLTIADLRGLQEASSIREIWIRRYTSRDDVEEASEEVLDLSIGIVPTTGIELFVVEWKGKITTFELGDEGWYVTEPDDRDEVPAQIFVHQMKPYVTIRRIDHARRIERLDDEE